MQEGIRGYMYMYMLYCTGTTGIHECTPSEYFVQFWMGIKNAPLLSSA